MGAVANQILVWVFLTIFGFLLTRRVLRTTSPWLTFGAAIPVALTVMLATFLPFAKLAGHPQGWVLGAILLFVGTVVLYTQRESAGAKPLDDFGFSPMQWAILMTVLTAGNLVLHTHQIVGPDAEFWWKFPALSLLVGGVVPTPHPYLSGVLEGWSAEHGIAIMGWFNGGGEAILAALWGFHHLMLLSAFLLAFGLGHRQGKTAGGFFVAGLLFVGLSVSGRVGLMDTYEFAFPIVLVLLLLSFMTESEQSVGGDILQGLSLAVLGFVSFPLALSGAVTAVFLLPLIGRRAPKELARPVAIGLAGCILSLLLGAQIEMGAQPSLSFGLTPYLGFAAVFILWPKRVAEGFAFWLFGLLSFGLSFVFGGELLVLAAGFGFAGTVGVALGQGWVRPQIGWKALAGLVSLVLVFPGLRLVNQTMTEIHKLPEVQRKRALSVLYPSPANWLIKTAEMTPDLMQAGASLNERTKPGDSLLTDIDSLIRESSLMGVAGMRAAAYEGTEEPVRTSSWKAFWDSKDGGVLPKIQSRWLLTSRPESREFLESLETVKRLEDFGSVTIWRYDGEFSE